MWAPEIPNWSDTELMWIESRWKATEPTLELHSKREPQHSPCVCFTMKEKQTNKIKQIKMDLYSLAKSPEDPRSRTYVKRWYLHSWGAGELVRPLPTCQCSTFMGGDLESLGFPYTYLTQDKLWGAFVLISIFIYLFNILFVVLFKVYFFKSPSSSTV